MNQNYHRQKQAKPEYLLITRRRILVALCGLVAVCGVLAFNYDFVASSSLLGMAFLANRYNSRLARMFMHAEARVRELGKK
ncbi:hypothetical protein ANRL4_01497 [Anaerolineae bacterium]|nr:hypothetical protein ANRL4_01497 [Anaerolineae bacterium]